MNTVLDMATALAAWFAGHPHVSAMTLGVVLGLGLTQWVKKASPIQLTRRQIQALSLPFGAVPTYFAWPAGEPLGVRVTTAIAVAVLAPSVYAVAVAVLRIVRPQWAEALSSDPLVGKDPTAGGARLKDEDEH